MLFKKNCMCSTIPFLPTHLSLYGCWSSPTCEWTGRVVWVEKHWFLCGGIDCFFSLGFLILLELLKVYICSFYFKRLSFFFKNENHRKEGNHHLLTIHPVAAAMINYIIYKISFSPHTSVWRETPHPVLTMGWGSQRKQQPQSPCATSAQVQPWVTTSLVLHCDSGGSPPVLPTPTHDRSTKSGWSRSQDILHEKIIKKENHRIPG